MIIAYLIISIFCIGVFFKPKEYTFLYCICSPIIYNFSVTNANLIISCCILFSYFIHRGKIFPFFKNIFFIPIIVQCSSIILSNLFGVYRHDGLAIRLIICLLPIFIIGVYLKEASDRYLKFCIKAFKILCIIVFIDATIELVTHHNLINELMLALGAYDNTIVRTYIEIRYGLKRCQSIFSIKTALGGFSLIAFGIFAYLHYTASIKTRQIYIWIMFFCAFISGTRSVMAGLALTLLMFFCKKIRSQMNSVQIALGIAFAALFMSSYLSNIAASFGTTNTIEGSNSELRESQFDISLLYMMRHPVLGNGLSFSWEYVVALFSKETAGLESVWFPLMIDRGIFGCISYILFYIFGCIVALKSHHYIIIFIYIGWLVTNTMTSLPGLNEIFFVPLFLLLHSVKERK